MKLTRKWAIWVIIATLIWYAILYTIFYRLNYYRDPNVMVMPPPCLEYQVFSNDVVFSHNGDFRWPSLFPTQDPSFDCGQLNSLIIFFMQLALIFSPAFLITVIFGTYATLKKRRL